MKIIYQIVNLIILTLWANISFAADFKVIQKDREFSVTELKIKAGDSISFVNQDDVAHNVYSRAPENKFEVRRQEPGTSETVIFKNPGVVKAKCAVHPQMVITITVE